MRAIEAARAAGGIGPDESSEAADEGTAAHLIREDCLALGLDAHDFIGTRVEVNGKQWPITEEVAEALQPGIDWIRERATGPLLVEHRVSLEPWLPGQFGTLDCGFVWRREDDFDEIVEAVLSDFKNGFIDVDPDGNFQQQIYGLALMRIVFGDDPERWRPLRIMIDQPKSGGIKEWVVTPAELARFGEWISARGAEALSGQGVFRPSDKACQWCPLAAPGLCQAHDDWLADMLFADEAGVPALPEPETVDDRARLFTIWLHRGQIVKWLEAIGEVGRQAALDGDPIPGSTLMTGNKGARYWTNKAAAAALMESALGDAAWGDRPLKSPTEIEKILKPGRNKPGNPEVWEKLQTLTNQSPAGPVLAAIGSKGRPWTAIEDDFDEMANDLKE